ncbi:MAG: hypothetical protein KIS82_03115 [Ferruginibacter sp.]|nr:hypothetical protein [Ferruginibacter sp.]
MKWLSFIFSHSIFVSLCSMALCYQTILLLGDNGNVYLYLLIFFSTLASYNLYWLLSRWKFNRRNPKEALKDGLSNLVILFLASIGTLVSFLFIPQIWPWLTGSVILTLFYSLPLWPVKIPFGLKEVGFLKTFLLALAWAYTTVFIPASLNEAGDDFRVWMIFLTRFLFMLMLCIMFDSRDAQIDRIHSLKTLATDLNPTAIKILMFITFALYMLVGLVFRSVFNDIPQTIAFLVVGVVTLLVYLGSQREKGYFYYYFVVDGLMLFSSLSAYLATIL